MLTRVCFFTTLIISRGFEIEYPGPDYDYIHFKGIDHWEQEHRSYPQ